VSWKIGKIMGLGAKYLAMEETLCEMLVIVDLKN